jgi:hypothetical protein
MTTADHASIDACPLRAHQLTPNGMGKVSEAWKIEARNILRFDIARALTLRNRTAELLRMAHEAQGQEHHNRGRFGVAMALAFGLMTGVAHAQTPNHTVPHALKCPGDKVVWVNTNSGIYHFQGERYFGSTKRGKFMCEHAADAEGDRPTHNGQ